MANSVSHFEIFANDVERARKFYEGVLVGASKSRGLRIFI